MTKRICIKVYDDEINIDKSVIDLKFNLLDNEKKL